MGHAPHAVLAYGYDLTKKAFDYNAPDPAWYTNDDEDWCTNAERALLAAAGSDSHDAEYISAEQVMQACGVELVRLDNDGDIQGVILAAKKHETDWNDNLTIPHLVLPDDVDDRLESALGILGIDLPDVLPEWILAAYHG